MFIESIIDGKKKTVNCPKWQIYASAPHFCWQERNQSECKEL